MSRDWGEIVRSSDGGGMRDFLNGDPIYCGSPLEMRVGDWTAGANGVDEFTWRARGVPVRYEIADRYRFFRDRVECKECGGTGKPCGKPPLPADDGARGVPGTWGERYCLGHEPGCVDSCSHCDGTGDVSGMLVGPAAGHWAWVRVAVLHYSVGNVEFVREVQPGDQFRRPARWRR